MSADVITIICVLFFLLLVISGVFNKKEIDKKGPIINSKSKKYLELIDCIKKIKINLNPQEELLIQNLDEFYINKEIEKYFEMIFPLDKDLIEYKGGFEAYMNSFLEDNILLKYSEDEYVPINWAKIYRIRKKNENLDFTLSEMAKITKPCSKCFNNEFIFIKRKKNRYKFLFECSKCKNDISFKFKYQRFEFDDFFGDLNMCGNESNLIGLAKKLTGKYYDWESLRQNISFKAALVENSNNKFDEANFYDSESWSSLENERVQYLKLERKRKKREISKEVKRGEKPSRKISQTVQDKVWRRDEGKCQKCGSKEKLEFDHIIPFSKGGANTYRNIQLLCESCNRSKSDKIG